MLKTHMRYDLYRPEIYNGKKVNTVCGLKGISHKHATGTQSYITCKNCLNRIAAIYG